MYKIITILIFLSYFCFCKAQEPLHYFLGKDFFNGTQLYSILQDEENIIWISSNRGIYNYDGISFKQLSAEESTTQSLFGLKQDNEGDIYCFNYNGQIFKIIDNQLEVFYEIPSELRGNNFSIDFDNLNNLIITSSGKTISVTQDKETETFNYFRSTFAAKRNDTLFYAKYPIDDSISIQGYVDGLASTYLNLPIRHTNTLLYSKFFLHQNDLFWFDISVNKFYKLNQNTLQDVGCTFPEKDYYRAFYSDGKFWVASTRSGVYMVDAEKLKTHQLQKWFTEYVISGVFTDSEDNTWLLTLDDGIIIIPNLEVKQVRLPDGKIAAMNKIHNKIHVSSKGGTIYEFNNFKFKKAAYLPNDRLEHFDIYQEKNLITTNTSIYKNGNRINDVISFSRATLLIDNLIYTASSNGFYEYNLNGNKLKRIYENRTHDICSSNDKERIYISSNNGLFVYDFDTVQPVKFKEKHIQPRKLFNVEEEIWVSSKNGIFILSEDESIKQLSIKDGLLSNDINNVKHEASNVYISSSNGFQLYDLETKAFKNLADDYRLTQSIKDFEVLNDTIYAITSDALLVFSFDEVKPKSFNYKTTIKSAVANGNKVVVDKSVLEPNDNNIAFSFQTTTNRFQEKLKYNYQLIGYEKSLQRAEDGQLIVNYSNLPAGRYSFTVQSEINGKLNESDTIEFQIQQHWYKTFLFKIAIVGLILLIIYSISRNSLNILERKRREEQFGKEIAESSLTSLKAQMNPHFMFNAMNSVQSLILKDERDEAYRYLTKLSQLVRKTLSLSDKTWVYLEEEIEQLTNYLELEKLRFKDDFTYAIELEGDLGGLKIPSMIIQPFVENAVKHGLLHKEGKKLVSIFFKLGKEALQCVIEDNGIGRAAAQAINKTKPNYNESFSTNSIQKRFDLYKKYLEQPIGFEYEDISQNNITGTKVIISIPYQSNE